MPTLTTTIDINDHTLNTLELSQKRGNRHDLKEQIEFILNTWADMYTTLEPSFNILREKITQVKEDETQRIDQKTN